MIIIDYFSIANIKLFFQKKAREYRKKTPVLARHVCPDEIGTTLITYISDANHSLGYKVETECLLSKDMVIVRNMTALHDSKGNPLYDKENKPIYNEYAMPITTFKKNYGHIAQLSKHFKKNFYKKITIKAIEVDDEVISILREHKRSNNSSSPEIRIRTSWGDELVEHGGLLTTEHYAISRRDSLETYVPVNNDSDQEDSETKCDSAPAFTR